MTTRRVPCWRAAENVTQVQVMARPPRPHGLLAAVPRLRPASAAPAAPSRPQGSPGTADSPTVAATTTTASALAPDSPAPPRSVVGDEERRPGHVADAVDPLPACSAGHAAASSAPSSAPGPPGETGEPPSEPPRPVSVAPTAYSGSPGNPNSPSRCGDFPPRGASRPPGSHSRHVSSRVRAQMGPQASLAPSGRVTTQRSPLEHGRAQFEQMGVFMRRPQSARAESTHRTDSPCACTRVPLARR
jgi:hypothetical protein